MLTVLQRVSSASVTVDNQVIGQIGPGLLALVSIHADDSPFDIQWMAQKITTLRIFPNPDPASNKAFDLDLLTTKGSLLLISNFTIAADTTAGRRPSLNPAAPPQIALPLFNSLLQTLKSQNIPLATGQFGAEMQVTLTNTGPATFLLDSRPSRPKPPPTAQ